MEQNKLKKEEFVKENTTKTLSKEEYEAKTKLLEKEAEFAAKYK